jgi:hypothetical protein
MASAKGTIYGAFVGLVSASVDLAIAFGLKVTPQEKTAVIAEATAITIIAPIIGALWDHSHRQAASRVAAAEVAAATLTPGVQLTTETQQ